MTSPTANSPLRSHTRPSGRSMLNLPALPYEVRCPLHGSIAFTELERKIIDHPFLQRLRGISQLGFAERVFPGATHTRFSHSLGVMHLAGRTFEQVLSTAWQLLAQSFTAEELVYIWKIIRLAGLLHDLGHPPFSHSFEAMLPPCGQLPLPREWHYQFDGKRQATHEDYSVAAIWALSQEQHPLLGEQEAQDICSLITALIRPAPGVLAQPASKEVSSIHPLLKQIISGEIDADRMDYLRRDAHYAGVTYGKIDIDRLITSLTCIGIEGSLVLALHQNAVYAYENFVMARFHMGMQVYFHKTLLPMEHFLKKAVEEGEIPFTMDGSLENFLVARDGLVLTQLAENQHKRWSSRLVARKPVSKILSMQDLPENMCAEEIVQTLRNAGIDPIHLREERTLSSLGQDAKNGIRPIYVEEIVLNHLRQKPLQEASVLLERYNQNFVIENIYCDAEELPAALRLLENLLD